MPQPKDPRSYPPEISRILWYVYKTGEPVTIPCPSRTAAITLRFRFGGYLAALRNCGYKEYESLGTLIARDNSRAISSGKLDESEAAVTVQPRALTETVLPDELVKAMRDFESSSLHLPEQPELEHSLGDEPEEVDNVDTAIGNLWKST